MDENNVAIENPPVAEETTVQPENASETAGSLEKEVQEKAEAERVAAEEAETAKHIELPGVKKRIDELTGAKHKEKEARIAAELRAAELERQLSEAKEQKGGPEYPAEPNPDDYIGRDAEYRSAMREWGLQLANVKAQYDQQQAEYTQQNQSVMQKKAAAMAKYDDFREVAENPTIAAIIVKAPAMNQALAECANMGDIMYFLGKNPAEVQRIAALSPYAQVMEIGRISDKLNTPTEKGAPPTKAPVPVKHVGGGDALSVDIYDPNLSTEERIKLWRARDAAGAAG